MIQTEYPFTLPVGYQDAEGTLHREGTMRLATAADEILPLKDPRVQSNQAYLIVILLSQIPGAHQQEGNGPLLVETQAVPV